MMTQSWTTLMGLSLLFMRPALATSYATWQFYENECYGTPTGEEAFYLNSPESETLTFPGGHFVEVGDACGPGNCFAITYEDECNACIVHYGTGCYNIDLGWEPTNFMAWCKPCSEVPAAGCGNGCH